MPIELTALLTMALASAVYLVRLGIVTRADEDDSVLEDLEDRVGALETAMPDLTQVKAIRVALTALDEKLEIEKQANDRANKNLIQKLNKHELQLAQVPSARR